MGSTSYCVSFRTNLDPNLIYQWQHMDSVLRLGILLLISFPLYILPLKILKGKWFRVHWMTLTYWTLTTQLILIFTAIHLFHENSPLRRLLAWMLPMTLPTIALPPLPSLSPSTETSTDVTSTPTDNTTPIQRSPSRSSQTLNELYLFVFSAPFLVKCVYAATLSHDDIFFPFLWLTSTLLNTTIFVWLFISLSAC